MPTSLALKPAPSDKAIEYGGFRFPNGARTLQFDCTPVKDSTQRTIIYNKWLIKVEAKLNGATPSATVEVVNRALALLNEPARP